MNDPNQSRQRRLIRFPTRLTIEDLQAIVAQATDPDSSYRVDGWLLMALAGELLELRAGLPREKAPRRGRDLPNQATLFDGVEIEPEPVMGAGWPVAPGTPLVCEAKVKPKRRKARKEVE